MISKNWKFVWKSMTKFHSNLTKFSRNYPWYDPWCDPITSWNCSFSNIMSWCDPWCDFEKMDFLCISESDLIHDLIIVDLKDFVCFSQRVSSKIYWKYTFFSWKKNPNIMSWCDPWCDFEKMDFKTRDVIHDVIRRFFQNNVCFYNE